MLKIASADKVAKVAVSRRVSGLEHQSAAAVTNAQKIHQVGKIMRKQHGGN